MSAPSAAKWQLEHRTDSAAGWTGGQSVETRHVLSLCPQWTYMRKGEYKMSVHAFNFLSESRYELKFTVSSIPCRPPDLMIRDSSTAFWMPKVRPLITES